MDAKLAQEIYNGFPWNQKRCRCEAIGCQHLEAKGYLDCLENGPEIKELKQREKDAAAVADHFKKEFEAAMFGWNAEREKTRALVEAADQLASNFDHVRYDFEKKGFIDTEMMNNDFNQWRKKREEALRPFKKEAQ